jgi:uncharacterized protein with gpF-like domain
MEELQRFQSVIFAELSAMSGLSAWEIAEVTRDIDAALTSFQASMVSELQSAFGEAYTLGREVVLNPLLTTGILQPGQYLPTEAHLTTILEFSPNLIQQITEEMRGAIAYQIRTAAIGGMSNFDAMAAITDILGAHKHYSIWARRRPPTKGIAARAETILRTELHRVNMIASWNQMVVVAESHPEIGKRWISTADPRTRDSHLDAHIDYMDNPIPVNEHYVVGGADLMYPGDPQGPPGETINCRCDSIVVHPEIGIPTGKMDDMIVEEMARREEEVV